MKTENFYESINRLSEICNSTFSILSPKHRTFENIFYDNELPLVIANVRYIFQDEEVLIYKGQRISSKNLYTFELIPKS